MKSQTVKMLEQLLNAHPGSVRLVFNQFNIEEEPTVKTLLLAYQEFGQQFTRALFNEIWNTESAEGKGNFWSKLAFWNWGKNKDQGTDTGNSDANMDPTDPDSDYWQSGDTEPKDENKSKFWGTFNNLFDTGLNIFKKIKEIKDDPTGRKDDQEWKEKLRKLEEEQKKKQKRLLIGVGVGFIILLVMILVLRKKS